MKMNSIDSLENKKSSTKIELTDVTTKNKYTGNRINNEDQRIGM